jgi:hypothetical protein
MTVSVSESGTRADYADFPGGVLFQIAHPAVLTNKTGEGATVSNCEQTRNMGSAIMIGGLGSRMGKSVCKLMTPGRTLL